ncbi:hypothetical protein ACE38V_11400 [Cytobacillus sp. Hz8]|uniref:hypothetical protein n=1 Tax=Cytobacillus sp. Hz8 TaxID=3347168 RepID=UPI0035E1B2D9
MSLKKIALSSSVGLGIFLSSMPVFAAEAEPTLIEFGEPVEQYQLPLNMEGVLSAQATISVSSNLECKEPLFSGNYALGSSSATVKEDSIYVKVRTFNGDGSLIDSGSATEKSSTFVSAKANSSIFFGDDYAISNHTYKKSGYETITSELKAYW